MMKVNWATFALTTLLTFGDPIVWSHPVIAAGTTPEITSIHEVKQVVTSFFNAEKSGNVEAMMKYSKYYLFHTDPKEFYKLMTKSMSLVNTTITDVQIVGNSFALVSYESKYKDRLIVTTAPVYKDANQWKLVTGIPPVDFTRNSVGNKESVGSFDGPFDEVKQVIANYIKAQKSGNVEEMVKYRKDISKNPSELKAYLRKLSQTHAEITLRDLVAVGDSLVLATLETKYSATTWYETIPVYKDQEGWKLVFGRKLVNAGIPIQSEL